MLITCGVVDWVVGSVQWGCGSEEQRGDVVSLAGNKEVVTLCNDNYEAGIDKEGVAFHNFVGKAGG